MWAVTPNGQTIPVDVDPVEDGNLFITRQGDVTEAVSCSTNDPRAKRGRAQGWDQYKSHFATCPDADQHRRAR